MFAPANLTGNPFAYELQSMELLGGFCASQLVRKNVFPVVHAINPSQILATVTLTTIVWFYQDTT